MHILMKTLTSIVCGVFLVACSSSGRGPALVPLQSELFAGAAYVPETQTLTLQYNHGAVWDFDGVPAATWQAFQAAPDAMVFYNTKIKNAFEGHRRVERPRSR